MRQDVEQALAFPSVEEADFHRGQMLGSPDQYEICELSPDGQITPVQCEVILTQNRLRLPR
jgi:hypothetical protein